MHQSLKNGKKMGVVELKEVSLPDLCPLLIST